METTDLPPPDSKNKTSYRPPQRLFKIDEIRDTIGENAGERLPSGGWSFEGNTYDEDGFLIKNFRADRVLTEGIKVGRNRDFTTDSCFIV